MTIIESNSQNLITVELESKLLENRLIFINEEIDSNLAIEVQTQIMYLCSLSNEPITIFINSVGGSVYAGLTIYDTIKLAQSRGVVISTINTGMCFSMASVLLMSGTKGYRFALPHSTTMLHTVSSGTSGKISDLIVDVEETKRLQNIINSIIKSDSSEELISKCEYKDLFLSVEDAIKYNIIDKVYEDSK